MRTKIYRDGLDIETDRPIRVSRTHDGHTVERLSLGKEHTYFVTIKGSPFCAHGATIAEAVADALWKDPSKRPSLEALKTEIQAAGKQRKITLQEFRILTGACAEGCRRFMQQTGTSGKPMTAAKFRDTVSREWGDKLLAILEWN
jgi:hypothetical protein